MDTEVRDLSTTATPLTTCPVFVPIDEDYRHCGEPLEVVSTRTIMGDDYGSWPTVDVSFRCGHTLADMASSIRHADEV